MTEWESYISLMQDLAKISLHLARGDSLLPIQRDLMDLRSKLQHMPLGDCPGTTKKDLQALLQELQLEQELR